MKTTQKERILLQEELVKIRRFLHQNAECGFNLDKTFAYISHKVPSLMVALAAGEKKDGHRYPLHHPKVTFDEAALSIGALIYSEVAHSYFNM